MDHVNWLPEGLAHRIHAHRPYVKRFPRDFWHIKVPVNIQYPISSLSHCRTMDHSVVEVRGKYPGLKSLGKIVFIPWMVYVPGMARMELVRDVWMGRVCPQLLRRSFLRWIILRFILFRMSGLVLVLLYKILVLVLVLRFSTVYRLFRFQLPRLEREIRFGVLGKHTMVLFMRPPSPNKVERKMKNESMSSWLYCVYV